MLGNIGAMPDKNPSSPLILDIDALESRLSSLDEYLSDLRSRITEAEDLRKQTEAAIEFARQYDLGTLETRFQTLSGKLSAPRKELPSSGGGDEIAEESASQEEYPAKPDLGPKSKAGAAAKAKSPSKKAKPVKARSTAKPAAQRKRAGTKSSGKSAAAPGKKTAVKKDSSAPKDLPSEENAGDASGNGSSVVGSNDPRSESVPSEAKDSDQPQSGAGVAPKQAGTAQRRRIPGRLSLWNRQKDSGSSASVDVKEELLRDVRLVLKDAYRDGDPVVMPDQIVRDIRFRSGHDYSEEEVAAAVGKMETDGSVRRRGDGYELVVEEQAA